jgi:hypothetical protein
MSAQIVNIPDGNFKAKLLASNTSNTIAINASNANVKIDSNNDGQIQFSEIQLVTALDVSSSTISDLTGLEAFTNLVSITANSNQITSFNFPTLSALEDVDLDNNQLTNFDFQSHPILYIVNLNGNNISAIDASSLGQVIYISANDNTNLLSVNCSNSPELYAFSSNNSSLETIDFTNCFSMENLGFQNASLSSAAVSGCSSLTHLWLPYNNLTSLDLTGDTSLIDLDCSDNQISNITSLSNCTLLEVAYLNDLPLNQSLDFSNFSHLNYLDVSGDTAVPAVNLTNCAALTFFNIGSGGGSDTITQLNFTNCSSLTTLYLSYLPYLQNVVFDGCTALTYIDFATDSLPTLNLDNLPQLETLAFNGGFFTTTVQLSNLPSLTWLKCDFSLITTLDVSGIPNLTQFECLGNDNLTTVYLKNGTNEAVTIDGMSLSYVCADEGQVASIQQSLIDTGNTTCTVNSYCTFVPGGLYSTVKGISRFDADSNGCDNADSLFKYLKLNITDNGAAVMTTKIPKNDGSYLIPLVNGNYTITPVIENPGYVNINPNNISVDFPTQTTPVIQDFCLIPNGIHNDLEVTLIPLGRARPGFTSFYSLKYKNKGNTIQSPNITIQFDGNVMDLQSYSSIPSASSANSASWSLSNLLPFQSGEIQVNFLLNSPSSTPPLNIGSVLQFNTEIASAVLDEVPNDNVATLNQNVVNSFDPNDKTCLEGEIVSANVIGEYVHYVIRFENTGTANAINIVVKDDIDLNQFDINTLFPIGASHDFETRITGNKVEFIFENINLPFDDASNDGYIAFKIKTKPTLTVGDTFSNTAAIYFDYNAPIVTNTATTIIQTLGHPDFAFDTYFSLYPNPAKTILNLQVNSEIYIRSMNIYNTLGQLVVAVPNANTVRTLDVASLASGIYYFKISTDKGETAIRFSKE